MNIKRHKISLLKIFAAGMTMSAVLGAGKMTALAEPVEIPQPKTAIVEAGAPAEQTGTSLVGTSVTEGGSTTLTVADAAGQSGAFAGAQGAAVTVVSGAAQSGGVSSGGASQGSATVVSGSVSSGGTTSGVITSGQSGRSVGPSMYGNLVTEGEKGTQPQEAILGGAVLTMLNSQSDSQMLSVLLETSQGSLIVVDGGLGADAEYLRSQIAARGGHVAAWLITHPHGDHVGALYQILQAEASGQATGITIDAIYYSFAAPEWYTAKDQSESTMAHSIIGSFAGLPQTMLHSVSKGQLIQVDDVTIQVLNDRYETETDRGNNAGIVYKAYVNGKSILFLGDMAEEGGNRLLSELGAAALKSDIVQMAHHGQNGVSEEVYKAISPSICLWPTPAWLWNNEGARYKTPVTKTWMSRLNVEKHYCMKDGDQMLR